LSLSFGGAGGGRGVQIQLVYPNNAVHVCQAIRFARGLWGRMFLSIIPAYTRMPSSWHEGQSFDSFSLPRSHLAHWLSGQILIVSNVYVVLRLYPCADCRQYKYFKNVSYGLQLAYV
jgi:hypothetical protein